VWDVKTGEQLWQFGYKVTSVSWKNDGTRLASSSWDRMVKIWNAEMGEELPQLTGETVVCFDGKGKTVASCSRDGTSDSGTQHGGRGGIDGGSDHGLGGPRAQQRGVIAGSIQYCRALGQRAGVAKLVRAAGGACSLIQMATA
jgi:hypothetical protein